MNPGIIALGTVMGLAFAAPPGVVTAETFRRGVRGGFSVALGVQLGSLVGDATYAALALVGLAVIAEAHAIQVALGALGAMFLLYLAWTSFAAASKTVTLTADGHIGSARRGAFLAGLVLSLTNPWAIAFGLSLGGALASLGIANATPRETAVFFTSFMAGSALWALTLSLGIARVRGWIGPKVFGLVSIVCGVALGAFGLAAFARVLTSILGI